MSPWKDSGENMIGRGSIQEGEFPPLVAIGSDRRSVGWRRSRGWVWGPGRGRYTFGHSGVRRFCQPDVGGGGGGTGLLRRERGQLTRATPSDYQ